MERRRLTLNSVSVVALNSRCNQLLQAFSSKLQYIQSQATGTSPKGNQQIAIMIQSKALQDQRRVYQLQAQTFKCYCNNGERVVARSVVTKKRQQLSEQLLNKLLVHIQLLECNKRSRWKNQWLRLSRANALNQGDKICTILGNSTIYRGWLHQLMSTLVDGTVAGDRWIERSGFVVSSASSSCVNRSADREENRKMKQSTIIREELIAVSTAESSSAL
ncbi:hypothetical protein F511_38705 [Dorcoceras hygrometricum]|uniref:Uncharacterized protein n=1 Tax=Dorcoceras hygrometricum TaxID=472368 RepID=A0A2Z7DD97_9LAMI|nr:hypothetical protein F511_38705 [Dorcoceras hygrometricum]